MSKGDKLPARRKESDMNATISTLAAEFNMEVHGLIAFALPIFEEYEGYDAATGLPDNTEVAAEDEAFIREAISR
ncbi:MULTISPECIES: hypothetical protein [Bacteria]|uniref:hypothetical protein n=1 Tax=Bacteria TaxID=2 RepID=UPI003C7B8F19